MAACFKRLPRKLICGLIALLTALYVFLFVSASRSRGVSTSSIAATFFAASELCDWTRTTGSDWYFQYGVGFINDEPIVDYYWTDTSDSLGSFQEKVESFIARTTFKKTQAFVEEVAAWSDGTSRLSLRITASADEKKPHRMQITHAKKP